MADIYFIDRITQKQEKEKVYGRVFLEALYGSSRICKVLSFFLRPLFAKVPLLSKMYGAFQKSSLSKWKIKPFIKTFQMDPSEFLEPVENFRSFNDFFIRKLKISSRPIASDKHIAVLPADARYLVFPNIEKADGFFVKGKKFSLIELLGSPSLAEKYAGGGLVMARLCPVDYHRFHFPFSCIASQSKLINGPLYSVNPIALRKNISILSENKRMITELTSAVFGKVLYIEVGATYVGSIEQTFASGKMHEKGEEKGFFSFGGSSLILLFERDRIEFDADLVEASKNHIETRGLLGQSLGRSL